MGQKVNYNKSKKNNIKIIGIVFLSLFVLVILFRTFKNLKDSLPIDLESPDKAEFYFSVKDYKTIEELIASYNCKFIRKEETSDLLKLYLQFEVDLYSGNNSNENYFLNMSKVIAEFIDYKNFELIDNNKNIDIEVKCENPNIIEYKINGDLNYYLNHDSKSNKSLSTKMTDFSIQSKELQNLIDKGWNEKNVDWGTKESTCNGYNIYFDEGIKYKNVSTDIFNIIFTSKYNGQVAGGLTTNSSKEEVEKALGEPTFSQGDSLYGYVSKICYLFFDFSNKQISVYPVIEISEDEEKELKELIKKMNNTSDIKTFATGLTNLWNDYDVYDYDSNYVDLIYTLKGFELSISSDSLKNGIFIYQNYLGNRNIVNMENVYMKDTDKVFDYEKSRSQNEKMSRNEIGQIDEEYYDKYLGINFSVRFNSMKSIDSKYYKGVKFYSRKEEYPDSELNKNIEISSYIWYDENKFIYSIDDDGIYVYNCITRVNVKIAECKGEIIINSANSGQIIYNDTEIINVDIN